MENIFLPHSQSYHHINLWTKIEIEQCNGEIERAAEIQIESENTLYTFKLP